MNKLTKEQAAIIGLYTGIACGPFADIHERAEKLLGRPVFTQEFANKEVWDRLKELIHPEFIGICHEAKKARDAK